MTRAPLALALLAAAACGDRAAAPPLQLGVAVSPTPAMVGSARVLVTVANAEGAPVTGATVIVTGRAPDGSETPLDTAREQAPGSYAAASFPLEAPGEWSLTARARLPDGREGAREHPIRVLGRPTP